MEKDGILLVAIMEFMDYNETILKNEKVAGGKSNGIHESEIL